ncbi:MAG: CBS domain-containing protein [Acidobacteriota bacterium]|nr:CBS domain-containing protein [Acidobacteriota bacterium]
MELNEAVTTVLGKKSRRICCIPPEESVYEAIAQMSRERVGALLVVSGARLEGIVSERDYARKVILMGRSSKTTTVGEIMSSPVIFVSPRATVGECMEIITRHRIRHLPVLDGETIAGVISIGDLVNWVLEEQSDRIRHLEAYIRTQA